MPKKPTTAEARMLAQLSKSKAPTKPSRSKAPGHATPAQSAPGAKKKRAQEADQEPGKTTTLYLYADETALVNQALITLLVDDGVRANQSQILRAALHVAFENPANIKSLRQKVERLKTEQDLRYK